jgi:hypothetical protein
MICNVCFSTEIDHVLSLPDYPLNSLYVTREDASRDRFKPKNFSVYICASCGHFQAESGVRLDELYNDEYNYNTQNTGVQGRLNFFLKQLDQITNTKFNRVIDIGCYDLSLLKAVKDRINANHFIGIDPSIPSNSLENSSGIICFKDYVDNVDIPHFDKELPDLIISDQTFEHIPLINSTLGNILKKVNDNSFFAICVPSMEVLIEKFNFHNLIHEHVNYFSVNTLSKLFQNHGLFLKDYTLNYTSTCGFLFGLFSKDFKVPNKEIEEGHCIDKDYFFKHYDLFKASLQSSLKIVADCGNEKIYGFGASDITANLAYFLNSDLSFLTNIFDDTIYKQNKYFPYLLPQIIQQNGIDALNNANCFITSPQAARYIYARVNALNFKRIINPIGIVS